MKLVRIPGILKRLYPQIIWDIPDAQPAVYITFDDGPTPGVTDQVLDILRRFTADATFFCIGRNVERHPETYTRILQSGHATGNHTYSHLNGWYTSDKEYYADIRLAAQFIQSSLYRPAYGMITPKQLKALMSYYRIILWDVMSYDFAINISPAQCLKNVIRHAQPGSIIVFHDSLKASEKVIHTLPRVLEFFREKGWQCKSIR